MNDYQQRLRQIIAKTFRKAKQWYSAYVACQIAILIFAVISIFAELNPNLSALFAFLGVLASGALRWRSDWWKSEGESTKVRWEMTDGFGIAPNSRDIADWLAARAGGFLNDVTPEEISGSAFASSQPTGPQRALENLQESAWWSKHLSRSMVVYLWVFLILLVCAASVALTISIGSLKPANVQQSGALVQNVGGIICAVLMFVFSIDLVRLLAGFAAFASAADEIVRRSTELLTSSKVAERDVLFVMHDYQTARSLAPLLPTFIWRRRREHLSAHWEQFRQNGEHGT